jgi:hypothetical protein
VCAPLLLRPTRARWLRTAARSPRVSAAGVTHGDTSACARLLQRGATRQRDANAVAVAIAATAGIERRDVVRAQARHARRRGGLAASSARRVVHCALWKQSARKERKTKKELPHTAQRSAPRADAGRHRA